MNNYIPNLREGFNDKIQNYGNKVYNGLVDFLTKDVNITKKNLATLVLGSSIFFCSCTAKVEEPVSVDEAYKLQEKLGLGAFDFTNARYKESKKKGRGGVLFFEKKDYAVDVSNSREPTFVLYVKQKPKKSELYVKDFDNDGIVDSVEIFNYKILNLQGPQSVIIEQHKPNLLSNLTMTSDYSEDVLKIVPDKIAIAPYQELMNKFRERQKEYKMNQKVKAEQSQEKQALKKQNASWLNQFFGHKKH